MDPPVSQTMASGVDDDIVLPVLPDAATPPLASEGSPAGGESPRRRGRLAWGAGLLAATVVGAIALVATQPWSGAAPEPATSTAPVARQSSTQETSAAASSSASPTSTVATSVVTPDKPAAVTDPTSFSDAFRLELACPSGGSNEGLTGSDTSVYLDEQLGVRGAYVAVRWGGQLALVDRVDQSVVWCAPLALGSLDGPAQVPSESPVGRPGYLPALNDDTLAAASPAGDGPIVAVAQSRLWVLLPVEISRPQIRSQQAQNFHAFIAYDDGGAPRWLSSFAAIEDVSNGNVVFRRDQTTGALLRVVEPTSTSAAPTSDLSLAFLDVSAGKAGKAWVAQGSGDDAGTGQFLGGNFITGVHRSGDAGSTSAVAGWRSDSGAQVFTTAYAESEINFAVTAGHVVTTRQVAATGESATVAAVYRLDTGAVTSLRLPFPTDLDDQCRWDGRDVLVCGSGYGVVATLAALDIAGSSLRWSWKTGDPDPVTKVPRIVPSEYDVWGRYVYARDPDNKPYLIDAQNGNDLTTPTTIVGPQDPYGSVETSDNAVQLTLPQA